MFDNNVQYSRKPTNSAHNELVTHSYPRISPCNTLITHGSECCMEYTVPRALKTYRELQRDMGPDRTVRIALHMFTHVLQVNMCFLYVRTRHIQI